MKHELDTVNSVNMCFEETFFGDDMPYTIFLYGCRWTVDDCLIWLHPQKGCGVVMLRLIYSASSKLNIILTVKQ